MKLDHTTEVPEYLWEAARVSRFMEEAQVGRWQLSRFEVTPETYQRKMFELRFKDHPELEMQRAVPPGDYIALRRRMLADEREDVILDQKGAGFIEILMEARNVTREEAIRLIVPESHDWIPVMSDTPAEILEHDHALNNATGVVVITGLGLGCLPHALLAKPGVKHIHIIEIDPEVIALTGKYLQDIRRDRVTIHRGSAMDVEKLLPEGMRADYVWHDIWTHVSNRNFDPATAEHGISYDMLFSLYADHLDVGMTGAWAYREAKIMEAALADQHRAELEFRGKLRSLPLDEAVELAWRHIIEERIKPAAPFDPDRPVPDEFAKILDPDFRLKAHLYETLGDPDFWTKFDAQPEGDATPLGRPNAHLEEAS